MQLRQRVSRRLRARAHRGPGWSGAGGSLSATEMKIDLVLSMLDEVDQVPQSIKSCGKGQTKATNSHICKCFDSRWKVFRGLGIPSKLPNFFLSCLTGYDAVWIYSKYGKYFTTFTSTERDLQIVNSNLHFSYSHFANCAAFLLFWIWRSLNIGYMQIFHNRHPCRKRFANHQFQYLHFSTFAKRSFEFNFKIARQFLNHMCKFMLEMVFKFNRSFRHIK